MVSPTNEIDTEPAGTPAPGARAATRRTGADRPSRACGTAWRPAGTDSDQTSSATSITTGWWAEDTRISRVPVCTAGRTISTRSRRWSVVRDTRSNVPMRRLFHRTRIWPQVEHVSASTRMRWACRPSLVRAAHFVVVDRAVPRKKLCPLNLVHPADRVIERSSNGTVVHRSPDHADTLCQRSVALADRQYERPGVAARVVVVRGVAANRVVSEPNAPVAAATRSRTA